MLTDKQLKTLTGGEKVYKVADQQGLYLPARHDDWGLKIVMMVVGALFGGVIGGGLSQIGKPRAQDKVRHWRTEEEIEPIPGMGTSGRDLAANYWRDEGHPQFMKPPRPEHGNRMLDADKNI